MSEHPDDCDCIEHKYSAGMAFVDQSPSFTHGYEVGVLSQLLLNSDPAQVIQRPCQRANEEVIRRLAAFRGYHVEITETQPGSPWVSATFAKPTNPRLVS